MILAHRGASKVARENTVEAFCEARRLGADGVELDVRASADGALVVHHDPDVAGVGVIASLRAADLPPHVPLLDGAIDACGDLVINIELKDLPGEPGYDPAYPLARQVAQLVADRALVGRVIVSSFDLVALDAAMDAEPALTTGWLTPRWFNQADALETLLERGYRALHPHYEAVTEALVAAAHDAGIRVTAWTADDPVSIRQLAEAGVDAIITNVPDLARATLSG
ncbi:MAG: glycerophosphodiester phosphodiesterase [Actinomycetota bacterium]|nr:glycerophosphodiester phosphodiesterase [Actinomycetota bacterium]